MPLYVPQNQKTESSINAQPKNMNRTIIHQILERDVAGWKAGDIAKDVGLTASRLSVITSSPMYDAMRRERLKELGERVMEKVSDAIADADKLLEDSRAEAAGVLVEVMRNGKSEAVRASIAERIVDRGKEKGGVNVVVQINEKLADRLDKVMGYDERAGLATPNVAPIQQKETI
jgi:vacuolar-type H+-ATPase subunit H